MSASAIAEALITTLSAASVFGACNVSTDYKVLEGSSACCCVVGFTELTSTQNTFGMGVDGSKENTWTFGTRIYLKDLGSAKELMRIRVPEIIDKYLSALRSDDTLQGTVEEIVSISSKRDLNTVYTVGGHSWMLLETEVVVREYD